MGKPKPLTVSNALLETTTRCSTKAVLNYVHRRQSREESAQLLAGSALHLGLAAWWGGAPAAVAKTLVKKHYKAWAVANIDPEDDMHRHLWRLSWDNVRRVFAYYLDAWPIAKLPFIPDPTRLEIKFALPLTKKGDIIFRGVIDASRVQDRKSGRLKTVDHKSGGNIYAPWFADRFTMDSQMTGYFWAENRLIPNPPVTGMWINAIEISLLPGLRDPDRKCVSHKLAYAECQPEHLKARLIEISRNQQSIADWRYDAIQVARRFRELQETYPDRADIPYVPQEGRFNGSCSFCEFKNFCLVGRPAERLDSMTAAREESGGW